MRANPFIVADAPPWLVSDEIPHVLNCMKRGAEQMPRVYEVLPWLRRMSVIILCMERVDLSVFPDKAFPSQEATLIAFFTPVNQPIAEMVKALYTTPVLRSMTMVGEILRRMALEEGRSPLSQEVVTGICAYFIHQRINYFEDTVQFQSAIWRLSWHQSRVCLRGIAKPIVILVTDEATGKVLAFRCTDNTPSATDFHLTLYYALVYPNINRAPFLWRLHPPTCLRVQGSRSQGIVQLAKAWEMEVEETLPEKCLFLQELEFEITDRVLDPIHYLRILDRVCERTFGYAPFRAKQQVARAIGWHALLEDEPTWKFPWLRELLPSYQTRVEEDGTIEWKGWHYRDAREDVLHYWAHEVVTVRPFPSNEATIWVYWNGTILC